MTADLPRGARAQLGEASLLLLARALGVAGTVVGIKVLATNLPPGEYGRVGLVLGMVALATGLVVTPLGQAYGRLHLPYEHEGRGAELRAAFRDLALRGAGRGAVLCALLGAWEAWQGHLGSWTAAALALLAALHVPLAALWGQVSNALNLHARRQAQVVVEGLRAWLKPVAVLGVVALGSPTALGCVLALWAMDALALASLGRGAWPALAGDPGAVSPEGAARTRERLRRFARPVALWGLAGWVQTSADRWVVDGLLSPQHLGLYYLASQVANLVPQTAAGVLSNLMAPRLYAPFPDASARVRAAGRLLVRAASLLALLGMAAAVLGSLAGTTLLAWLGGEAYATAGALLPTLIVAATLLHMAHLHSTLAIVDETPARLLPSRLLGGVLTGAAMLAGGALHGLLGIALGRLVGAAGLLAHTLWVVRRIAHEHRSGA